MIITVRKAEKDEINWINLKYQEVNFIESNFDNEFIVIAECDTKPCGLGRLIIIDNDNLELGGIYVFYDFRGLNVSQEIIRFLIEKSDFSQKNIWCLPFSHLKKNYERFGFRDSIYEKRTIPNKILKKHQWCELNSENKVLILLNNKKSNDTNNRFKPRNIFRNACL